MIKTTKRSINQSLGDPERFFKCLENVNVSNVKGADCCKKNRICIALYTGHTGNEKHRRQRKRVQIIVCVQWTVGGCPKAFTRWTTASTLLASKSRGGGRGWFQLITAVPRASSSQLYYTVSFFPFSIPDSAKRTTLVLYS